MIMETKEMTQKEVFEFLKNRKIRCESREESEKIQKKLFELGYTFRNSEQKILSTYLIYIIDNFKLQIGNNYDSWIKNESKMIAPNEILEIKIKEEKPKFDPQSLQPFDKVLTRCNEQDIWRCNLFSHRQEDYYRCTAGCYSMCIPYNEDTKYLIGTANMAPEFYRI